MLLICNGMYRSGSTLQYNLVKGLVESSHLGEGESFFSASDVNRMKETFSEWENDNVYHVIKMHDVYPYLNNSSDKIKVFYIYRDLRDVATSLIEKLNLEQDGLIEMLDAAVSSSEEIMRHPGTYSQQYERVLNDLHVALYEISSCLNIPINKEVLDKIVNECSIESVEMRLQKQPILLKIMYYFLKKIGKQIIKYDRDSLIHYNHISKNRGSIGSWKGNLDNHIVKIINQRYSSWLRAKGYQ